ncbi:LLM class flavin-dependent oxidoreductase [Gryllotalpicola ginsengisoli]|uniref:LLM class flavin-dependent oxidoreductase n=1 Tax=Gryllotalpicola ginsengisoli TaxID=444608 RepID=UPI00042468FD|nr:LLM class flavin-dependent oxidoreductase [Gryllotalpicola ginsengisoli]
MGETTDGPRPFRFGVVAPVRSDLATWREQVRRIADSGYSALLMPDVPGFQPAPGPTLATAAALAPLRVGTWVYASALRQPWSTAWEAHSLSVLTEGRFEMGVGLGRPGIETEQGLPRVSGAERLARMRETVAALRELDGAEAHTPVTMAVGGPRSRKLAAEVADAATFVLGPEDGRGEITARVGELRGSGLELAQHVAVVGDITAPFMAQPGLDTAALHAAGSLMALPDDPAAAIDELQRRREEIGFSYFVFGSVAADAMAPVVAELAGR